MTLERQVLNRITKETDEYSYHVIMMSCCGVPCMVTDLLLEYTIFNNKSFLSRIVNGSLDH